MQMMWIASWLAVAALAGAAACPTPVRSEPAASTPELQCKKGPLKRTFGGAAWLVYGCDDGKSLVFVTPQGNPAFPFYFILTPANGAYQIDGEGNGDRSASDVVLGELQRLTPAQIAEMLHAASAVRSHR